MFLDGGRHFPNGAVRSFRIHHRPVPSMLLRYRTGVPYASDGNTNYWDIEIETLGDGADPYPAEQIDALVWRWRASPPS